MVQVEQGHERNWNGIVPRTIGNCQVIRLTRHTEDFENAGVILGAGMTLRWIDLSGGDVKLGVPRRDALF